MRQLLAFPIARRVVGLALLFALPVVVLASQLASTHLHDIEATERELVGVTLSKAITSSQHRFVQSAVAATTTSALPIGIQARFEEANQPLKRELEAHQLALASWRASGVTTTATLDRLDAAVHGLRATSDSFSEPFDRDALLNANAKYVRLLAHVGDASGLILDPELDTYYVMDLFLLTIPQLRTRVLELQTALPKPGIDSEATLWIRRLETLLRADLERLGATLESATAANRNSSKDGESFPQGHASFKRAVALTDSILAELKGNAISNEDRRRSAIEQLTALETTLYEMQQQALRDEAILLNRRTRAGKTNLYGELSLAALCLLAALTLGFRIAHSLVNRIVALKRASNAFTAGRRDIKARVSGEDELAELAVAFNALTSMVNTLELESKRRGDALEASNQNLEQLIHQRTAELAIRNDALDRIAVVAETDTRGSITYVNDALVKLSKYSREELLGQNHRMLNSGHHPREFFQGMWSTIAKGGLWHAEIKNRAKDGTIYWVETWIFPQRDPSGRIEKYLAIRLDITQRKEMESRLIEARNAAMAALEAKGSFLANMSHEIRTPLNGVLGAAQLALSSPTLEEKDEMAQLILSSGQSLMVIINDILDYSKLESGKMTLERVPVDLRSLVEESVFLFKTPAGERGIALEIRYPTSAPRYILADPTRLRQILLNLLSNAVKFTNRGSVTCGVEFADVRNNEARLEIAVQDTGIGLTEEQQARIFERFTQADASTTRVHGGTGLGTSISQGLAALMQGHISLRSEANVGSTFTLSLPVALTERESPDRPKAEPVKRKYGRRVLLVEDNVVNQKIAIKLLQSLGLEVTLARNGAEALEMAPPLTPDLVLMDIQMPVMDGVEATRRLIESGFHVPIVAMTANVMAEDVVQYLQVGMVGHVPKPFQLSEIVSVLDAHLRGPGAPSA